MHLITSCTGKKATTPKTPSLLFSLHCHLSTPSSDTSTHKIIIPEPSGSFFMVVFYKDNYTDCRDRAEFVVITNETLLLQDMCVALGSTLTLVNNSCFVFAPDQSHRDSPIKWKHCWKRWAQSQVSKFWGQSRNVMLSLIAGGGFNSKLREFVYKLITYYSI